ncbi:unnamed protein product [Cochlearia groenlandica]
MSSGTKNSLSISTFHSLVVGSVRASTYNKSSISSLLLVGFLAGISGIQGSLHTLVHNPKPIVLRSPESNKGLAAKILLHPRDGLYESSTCKGSEYLEIWKFH